MKIGSDEKHSLVSHKKFSAKKIMELCFASMAPNVIADVTSRPRINDWLSVQWDLDQALFIGNRESGDENADAWDIRHELASETGRKFWTAAGMLGRIRGLISSDLFRKGSLVDKMYLFMVSEVSIKFTDFRTIFRHIFGVNDAELFASVRELAKQNAITIISMRKNDEMAVGPFIIQSAVCGMESFAMMFDCNWVNQTRGCTVYPVHSLTLLQLDGLIMHMFMYCNMDTELQCTPDDIRAFHVLDEYYHAGIGSLDACYPYLCELMRVETRDIIKDDLCLPKDREYEEKCALVEAIYHLQQRYKKKLIETAKQSTQPAAYQYLCCPIEKENADQSDIDRAITLLKTEMDSLRKDPKTGKVINTEKICRILNTIPKIFSLKSMYEIFKQFDMDQEVVRRDVRALCKKGIIVSVGRGLYCSRQYADEHLGKVGTMSDSSDDDTVQDQLISTLMNKLDGEFKRLQKVINKLSKIEE